MRVLIILNLFINFFYLTSCAGKKDYVIEDFQQNNTVENTFIFQQKFQAKLDEYVRLKRVNIDKEQILSPNDGLDTREKAEIFSKTLVAMKFPKCKDSINKYFEISEDRTGKLWFVSIGLYPPGQALDGRVSLIIFKNNCKVLYYSNHM